MSAAILHTLVHAGVTHVVGIPDNTSGPLLDAVRGHATIRLITATREGEAIAIAAGLWMGGASPLVVMQNTGLLESGDAIRGTALRMRAAVPIVVTGRGYAKMRDADIDPTAHHTIEELTRADVDSTALLTEPTLAAWGIPYRMCDAGDDVSESLRATILEARADDRPTAMILTRSVADA